MRIVGRILLGFLVVVLAAALGAFWGPLATETRVWLDHVLSGQPCALATPEQARLSLETTIAIDRAARTGLPVRLPLDL
jgi:hypothetical protein